MSNTIVGFTIQIEGVQSINQLNAAIKQTNAEINALDQTTEEGAQQVGELRNKLGQLVAQQKALKKAQDDVNKSFLPEKAVGAYDALSAKLNKLRKEFKNAALDGSKTTAELDAMQKEIQQLDQTLKKVDGQVGQFQRNVGNYPKTFSRVTRSLMGTIPGFEQFSQTLKNGEGKINGFGKALIGGFVAFQAANLIIKAIGKLNEFLDKINETKDAVRDLSGASGEDLNGLTARTKALADTFKVDAKDIAEAAKAISKQFGISFGDALLKIQGALVEGRGNTEDYLSLIKEMPEAFRGASGQINEFSKRNQTLVDTNLALAQSQVDVANKLQGTSDAFSVIGNALQTGFLLSIAKLMEVFKPVSDAFSEMGTLLGKLFGQFQKGGQQIDVFDYILEIFVAQLRMLSAILQISVAGFNSFLKGINYIVESIPFLQNFFKIFNIGFQSNMDVIKNFPHVLNGVIGALEAMAKNFIHIIEDLVTQNIEILYEKNPLAKNFAKQMKALGMDVEGALYDLKKRREKADKTQLTLTEAYNKAYLESQKKADNSVIVQQQSTQKTLSKEQIEAQKKQQEAAQEAAKKLSEERAKFQEDEVKQARQRTALLSDLSAKAIEERIKNIKDGYQRELAEINNNFEQQKAAQQKQYDDLVEAAKQREKELVKTFGEGSQEVIQARENNTIQIEAIAKAQADILIQFEQQKNDAISKLNEEQRLSEVKKAEDQVQKLREIRDMALSSELDYIQKQGELKELKNQETLNKLLAQETDAKKKEQIIKLAAEQETIDKIANLNNQIQALNDAELQLLDENKNLKVGITQEEYDAILLERQKLFTELSDIEKKQTEDVAQNAAEQTKIRQDQFNQVLEYFKQGIDLIGQAFEVANERQQAAFDADIERSQLRQEKLQEELENSTGLRRRFFQEQLDNEIANQQRLEKAKEEIIKKGAKQQKAVAIIQSIINTALAVSSALATPPAPNIVAAAIAGIAGAAQTALIAAQPLAEGGVVGKLGGDIVQFADGGKVTSKGNIKPLSNGDNVLATLKTGEVVLNQDQQRRIGYSTLKAARIPNFATGGVVGAPSAFLQDSLNRASEEQNRLKVMQDLVIETQGRIDRLQVVYTASTEDDVTKARNERKEIRTTAQF